MIVAGLSDLQTLATPPLAVALALSVDRWFGEPRARWHPVVWMGKYLSLLGPALIRQQPVLAFVGGAAAWVIGAGVVGLIAVAAERALGDLPLPLTVLGLGLLLKPMLSWQMLHDEVAAVERALARSVDEGCVRLQRLVSRDVFALDAVQVRESALESLAENLNDSVVAPLFWFAVGGLGAAAVYRFANTADAMWGYRGRHEWAGKWAARADDVLSWLPARLTALLLCLAAGRAVVWTDLSAAARATPSPNGGWPMGALALLLRVRLGKPGVYVLNPRGAPTASVHTVTALHWSQRVVWLAALAAALLGGSIGAIGLGA